MREDFAPLRHVADAARGAAIGGLPRYVLAAIENGAAAHREETDQRAHQRALADAVAAKHADDLAGADFDADVLQHVAGGVARAQAGGGDQRVHRSGPPEIDASHVRMLGDLINGPLGEDAALMQHRDPLRDLAHERDVVLDDDDCQAARLRCLRTGAVCSVSSGDMPAVGSSSSRMSGPAASTMAISSHCS